MDHIKYEDSSDVVYYLWKQMGCLSNNGDWGQPFIWSCDLGELCSCLN